MSRTLPHFHLSAFTLYSVMIRSKSNPEVSYGWFGTYYYFFRCDPVSDGKPISIIECSSKKSVPSSIRVEI